MILGERDVFDLGFFEIYFIENNGMAFGTELGGTTGKLLLSLFRLVAIGGIGWYLYSLIKNQKHKGLVFSIALVFAGAFGNIIDSIFYGMVFSESPQVPMTFMPPAEFMPEGGGYAGVFYGKVVDMLHFTVVWPDWMPGVGGNEVFPPVFNVADSAISIGVIIILIRQRKFFPSSSTDWNIFKSKRKQQDKKEELQSEQ